jgi:glutathione S-transferase
MDNLRDCQAQGQSALQVLEQHLQKNRWLALGHRTIADLAHYVALAEEGGILLDPYSSVLAWMKCIQMLPGYVVTPALRQV